MRTVEKHMDLLTMEDLQMLIAEREGPCISLYMPTHRQAPEVQQNPVRFKNLIAEITNRLDHVGLDSGQIDALFEPIQSILEQEELGFWRTMSDGLAVFLAPDFSAYYRLPYDFDEFIFVGENFHIRQLLPLFADDAEFYVLALNQDNARLVRGNRYQVGEVDLTGVPQSLAEVLQYDDFERNLQLHSTANSTRGSQDALFHGHGNAADEAVQQEQVLRFFKALDRGICDFLNAGPPLILAGISSLRGLYRQANHYQNLLDEYIEVDPQSLDDIELHQRAWKIMQPYFQQTLMKAIDQYRLYAGNQDGRATSELEHIVASAHYQRVDTLFLPKETKRWGVFDSDNNTVTVHAQFHDGDHDLLNVAAIHTLANGGTVHTVDSEPAPDDQSVAAILRY